MSLRYGCWQTKGIFWSVEGVAEANRAPTKGVLETAKDIVKTEVQGKWVRHAGWLEARAGDLACTFLLTVIEGDINWKPVGSLVVI